MKINLKSLFSQDSLNEVIRKTRENFEKIQEKINGIDNKISNLQSNLNTIQLEGPTDFTLSASRTKEVTDSYLFNNNLPTNIAPLIVPSRSKIKFVSITTPGVETWDLEIRLNGNTIKTININGNDTEYIDLESENIFVGKGAQLSLYCKGTNINKPNVQLIVTSI